MAAWQVAPDGAAGGIVPVPHRTRPTARSALRHHARRDIAMRINAKLTGTAHVVSVDGEPVAVLTVAREARRLREALADNLPGAEVFLDEVPTDTMPHGRYPELRVWLSKLTRKLAEPEPGHAV